MNNCIPVDIFFGTPSFIYIRISYPVVLFCDLIFFFFPFRFSFFFFHAYYCIMQGHSLGGGLATLAAFLLACDKSFSPETKMEKRKIQCIAFADPCVGNVGFQRAMAVLAHYKNDGSSSWQYPDPTSQKLKVRPGHVNSHCTLNYTRFQNDRDVVPMMFPVRSNVH